jgi:hypothetical protein
VSMIWSVLLFSGLAAHLPDYSSYSTS